MSSNCRALSRSSVVVALLALSGLGGCRASYVDRGAALYANRNYVEADELFEHNEARLKTASNAERARYALYRGVTLLSLGDSARSRYWLSYATRCAEREPDALSADEQATLDRALETHAKYEARLAERRQAQAASASLDVAPTAQ